MATSSFEVEDQTDEDFFDRLVNDDIDFTGYVHNSGEKKEFDEVKAFSNLSISELGPVGVNTSGNGSFGVNGELGHEEETVLESLDTLQDPIVVKESQSLTPVSKNEASALDDGANNRNEETALGNGNEFKALQDLQDKVEEAGVDGTLNETIASDGRGVKLVQWSSFNSDLNPSGGHSDFFSEVGDYSGDSLANFGNIDKSSFQSNVTDSVLENSGDPFANLCNTDRSTAQSIVTDSVLENSGDPFVNLDNADTNWNQSSNVTNSLLDNSGDPFANLGNADTFWTQSSNVTDSMLVNSVALADPGASSYIQHQEGQHDRITQEHSSDGQDLNSSQNWENLYPGWRFDPNTGQWYQLEGYDVGANKNQDMKSNAYAQESFNVNSQSTDNMVFSYQKTDADYFRQPTQSVSQNVAQGCETSTDYNWNQQSNGKSDYPAHMVFDPQYPGWYYDTITQEWKQLESSAPAFDQLSSVEYNQQFNNTNVENHGSQGLHVEQNVANWDGSMTTYNQQNTSMWNNQTVAKIGTVSTEKLQYANKYLSTEHVNNSMNQQIGFNPSGSIALNEQARAGYDTSSGVSGFESFNPVGSFSQIQHPAKEPIQVMQFSPANFDSQKSVHFSQQPVQSGTQFSHEASAGRSSAGRPPHALVTFGFGGKLIVMKDDSYFPGNLTYGSQGSAGGVISVHNLMEVVVDKDAAESFGNNGCDFFHALCQQSFPGPLVGGNVGSKELNKWVDDKIANSETPYMDFKQGDHLRLLFSLLKLACQHYGKLRSPFGTDVALKDTDTPESAVAKLLASAKRSNGHGALMLQNMASEAQLQATALEVQKLLVSGRKKEALQCAQEGQLWGPAIVIASQLGDQFYGDTVKHMAVSQLTTGSPLRTLCLLIAGQPADVFSNATLESGLPNSLNVSQPMQIGANYMLDDWEENLAILTANRTKDDELVIIHLGDCLLKERGQNIAAHICYLVAEADFEPYSDSARVCLLGANHWKFPRTYVSPEAIQRTELYEYSRVLGNSQFVLLPFQPYKLIYAHMLAEVGKVADALKYCQAILKCLKYGRTPEADTWRQLASSLEERIRAHQEGGYSTNLAPAKLMGKLLTLFDSTAQRVVGGLPPPVPSTSQGHAQQGGGLIVPNTQSAMAISSLVPSASMEPIREWTAASNELNMPNRSISEPGFGRNPGKVDSSKMVDSSKSLEKPTTVRASSRFGNFRAQIFQKTLGLVTRSRQAKLGEENKFYYDEKLKRWVEEGVEPPAEAAALPPPPPTAAFENRTQDYSMNAASKTESFHAVSGPQINSLAPAEQSSGIPPIPPTSNQFSARGRTGVRSRYVDTFNKGGGSPGNSFQSPSIPFARPGGVPSPKIFIPSAVTSFEETVQTPGESTDESSVTDNTPPKSSQDVFSTPQISASSSTMMHRFPSMDNIVQNRSGEMANGSGFAPPQSRRVSSWSGSLNHVSNPSVGNEIRPQGGEAPGRSPLSHMQTAPPSMEFSRSGSFGDELHEVEL